MKGLKWYKNRAKLNREEQRNVWEGKGRKSEGKKKQREASGVVVVCLFVFFLLFLFCFHLPTLHCRSHWQSQATMFAHFVAFLSFFLSYFIWSFPSFSSLVKRISPSSSLHYQSSSSPNKRWRLRDFSFPNSKASSSSSQKGRNNQTPDQKNHDPHPKRNITHSPNQKHNQQSGEEGRREERLKKAEGKRDLLIFCTVHRLPLPAPNSSFRGKGKRK